MKPVQHLDLSVQFSSWLSPWWLLLVLPAVVGLGWLLYRREIRWLPRRRVLTLLGLRLGLMGLVTIGIFMPSLDVVRRLTFPGRILVIVDNSESMTAADSSMPAVDAVALGRALGKGEARDADAKTAFHRFAGSMDDLSALAGQCRRALTQQEANEAARRTAVRLFLDHATVVLMECDQALPSLAAPAMGPDAQEKRAALLARYAALRKDLPRMAASANLSASALGDALKALGDLAAGFRVLQGEVDRAAIAGGDVSLKALSEKVRAAPRLDLVNQAVASLMPAIRTWAPGQYVQVADLMRGGTATLGPRDACPVLAPSRGRTNIRQWLRAVISAASDFPLTAVVLVSDGRDLGRTKIEDTLQQYVKRRVPIFCGGVGYVAEPRDIAIAELTAPPVGVKGQPVAVDLRVKAAVPLPLKRALRVNTGGEVVASQTVELTQERQLVGIQIVPRSVGLHRYTVSIEPAAEDAFKTRNNAATFVLDVSPERRRVLLFDERPRWQTRFVVNILSRLPYVDLNSIVRVVQKDGELKRGSVRGSWPDSAEALGIYDAVVLGRFDKPALTEAEWGRLAAFVKEGGGTLVVLAPGEARQYPESIRELFPLAPSAASDTSRLDETSTADLRLTEAGRLHPLTRAFPPDFSIGAYAGPAPRTQSVVLLHDARTNRPVLSCRFVGRGKVLMLHSDRLWMCLNERYLAQHAAIFSTLIDWAGTTRRGSMAVDQRVLAEGDAFQVWTIGSAGDVSVLDAHGKTVAKARTAPAAGSPNLFRAVFAPLPPGDYSVAGVGADAAGPLSVAPDNEEVVTLAQDADYLRRLARVSGGAYAGFADMAGFFPGMDLKERTEVHRYVFQLWSSQLILLLLLLLLAVEWVLRKYWSLV